MTDKKKQELIDTVNNIDFGELEKRTNISLDDLHIFVDCEDNFNYLKANILESGWGSQNMPVIWDKDGKAYMCDPFSDWKVRKSELDIDFRYED